MSASPASFAIERHAVPGLPQTQEQRERLRAAKAHAGKLVAAVGRELERTGKLGRAYYRALRNLYRSKDARLSAAHAANMKTHQRYRRPFAEIELLAPSIDPRKPIDERITAKIKRKPADPGKEMPRYRVTLRFELRRKAAQTLVTMAMKPVADATIRPDQFGARGVPALLQELGRLSTDGYVYIRSLDVKDAFPSVDQPDEIARITGQPLSAIRETVLINETMKSQISNSEKSEVKSGRYGEPSREYIIAMKGWARGLGQGAVSSPRAFEIYLAHVLSAVTLPEGVKLLMYVDNAYVVSKRADQLEAVCEELKAVLAAARTPLELREVLSYQTTRRGTRTEFVEHSEMCQIGTRRLCDGIEMLGRKVRKRRGALKIDPSKKMMGRLSQRVHKAATSASKQFPCQTTARSLLRAIRGIATGFNSVVGALVREAELALWRASAAPLARQLRCAWAAA